MKKYQNVSTGLVCVEFEDYSQFLYTGQSVTTDAVLKRVPKGVNVTVIEEVIVKEKPKASSKKKVAKQVNLGV